MKLCQAVAEMLSIAFICVLQLLTLSITYSYVYILQILTPSFDDTIPQFASSLPTIKQKVAKPVKPELVGIVC